MLFRLVCGLVLIVALVAAQSDPVYDSLLATTGALSPIACNGPANEYQFQIRNSFPYAANFSISLDCVGCAANTVLVVVNALSTSASVGVSPAPGCFISNRDCTLTVYFEDVTTQPPTQALVSTASGVCGTSTPTDYTPGCDYWDWSCRVTNGDWYHYAPFLLPMFDLLPALIIGVIVFMVKVMRERRFLFRLKRIRKDMLPPVANPITFGMGATTNFATNTRTPLQQRPADFGTYSRGAAGAPLTMANESSGPSAGSGKHSQPLADMARNISAKAMKYQ